MEEITHFTGIIPAERWKNDVLSELRMIRKLLERDSKTVQEKTEQPKTMTIKPKTKQTYTRRGVKP